MEALQLKVKKRISSSRSPPRRGWILQCFGASWGHRLRLQASERTDERHNLPNLVGRKAATPRWHALGTALADGVEQVVGSITVRECGRKQVQPHPTAAMRAMTNPAVVPQEKALS